MCDVLAVLLCVLTRYDGMKRRSAMEDSLMMVLRVMRSSSDDSSERMVPASTHV